MPLTETIRRWRRLHRLRQTVAKAARDPSQIEHLAERSGFDAALIRRCVAAIDPPAAQLRVSAEKSTQLEEVDPALLERIRRAMCMLIGLSCSEQESESVMSSLRHAWMAHDEESMTRITRVIERHHNIERKGQSPNNLSSRGASRDRRPSLVQELKQLKRSMQSELADWAREITELHVQTETSAAILLARQRASVKAAIGDTALSWTTDAPSLIKHVPMVWFVVAHLSDRLNLAPMAMMEQVQLLSSLVECLWGNPDALEALATASLHTRQALAFRDKNGADDVLLVAVRRVERETQKLEKLTDTSAEQVASALDLLAENAFDRDLWWSMSGSEAQAGTIRARDPIPADVDLAWTTLKHFASQRAELLGKLAEKPAPQIADLQTSDTIGELFAEISTPIKIVETAPENGDEAPLEDTLTVALLHEIENDGTLSWPACLRLANARAWPHRYVDAWEHDENLHVSIDAVAPRTDGSIELRYRALEQPLSYRFRSYFETLHIDGRMRVLTKLVDYALSAYEAAIVVGRETIEQSVRDREEVLWNHLNHKDGSP